MTTDTHTHYKKHWTLHIRCMLSFRLTCAFISGFTPEMKPGLPIRQPIVIFAAGLLWSRCPSCRPTNTVKGLNGTWNTNFNHPPDSSFSIHEGFLTERTLIFDASTQSAHLFNLIYTYITQSVCLFLCSLCTATALSGCGPNRQLASVPPNLRNGHGPGPLSERQQARALRAVRLRRCKWVASSIREFATNGQQTQPDRAWQAREVTDRHIGGTMHR